MVELKQVGSNILVLNCIAETSKSYWNLLAPSNMCYYKTKKSWRKVFPVKKSNILISQLALFVQSQQLKHQNNVWNLFKVHNKDTRMTSIVNNILVSLLLTLNWFHTLLCCFYYWLWANKCWLGLLLHEPISHKYSLLLQ